MLSGVIAAIFIYVCYHTKNELETTLSESLKPAGLVLGITGAGGALGEIISLTGGGEALIQGFGISSGVPLVLIGFTLAAIIRIAQGSATVAAITSMNIIADAGLASLGVPGFVVALACLSGGTVFGHINDSGFWVVTNLTGLTVTGGLKTHTIGTTIPSVFILVIALGLAALL
jgi:H+/gluconate symporter-like permease